MFVCLQKTMLFLFCFLSGTTAFAETTSPLINSGDTAWMLVSAALVLFMVPGLAFFYAGMASHKNVISTLYQNIISLGVVGLLWVFVGFSLAFAPGNLFLGGFDYVFFNHVGGTADSTTTIPFIVFAMFQMMFAIITPAIMTGTFVGRVSFSAWLIVLILWSLMVYAPVAHWVWASTGWLFAKGALDFAGGFVVHMTSGFSALTIAFIMGHSKDFGKPHQPYHIGFVALGTSLLFFGWFGFNGGSALAANGIAGISFSNTFIAGVAAMLAWTLLDTIRSGKPALMGGCIGLVAGLVVITPAAGYVTPAGALFSGMIGGIVCNLAASFVKETLKIDDTLDVFACHGVGGFLGSIVTGLFSTTKVNPAGKDGLLAGGNADLLIANLTASVAIVIYSMLVTFIIFKLVNCFFSVRVSEEDEKEGLDQVHHGEKISA